MKNRLLNAALMTLMICSASATMAAGNGGGSPGGGSGGGFFCKLWCDIRHGSCEIPSGDPSIPPLKDPFCAQRKADCKAACGGGSGGGSIFIGSLLPEPRDDWQMSPTSSAACSASALTPAAS